VWEVRLLMWVSDDAARKRWMRLIQRIVAMGLANIELQRYVGVRILLLRSFDGARIFPALLR
jgi:hypothetical protein